MSTTNGKHDRVRVLQLRAHNVKKIREVSIDFDGEIHEIRGDSGQGKTTILESIEAALRGMDPSMVRLGADKAELELTLTEATIKRIVPRNGKQTVMVTDSNGHPIDKAQSFLNAICGPAAFQPIAWVRLGGGEAKGKTERLRRQRDQLLEAIPMSLNHEQVWAAVESLGEEYTGALGEVNMDLVNFEQHAFIVCEALERLVYEYRTQQNKRVEEAENRLELTPSPETAAPKQSAESLAALAEELNQAYWTAKGKQDNRATLRERRDALAAQIAQEAEELPDPSEVSEAITDCQQECEAAQAEITRLEALLSEQRSRLEENRGKIAQLEAIDRQCNNHEARKTDLAVLDKELAGESPEVDLDSLQAELDKARKQLEARKLQDAHDAAAAQYADAKRRSDLFKKLVEMFRDDIPKALLESTELPVDGLGIDGETVTIHGVPVHQLGTSEQIRVGVVIAAALNPRSGFVLVDGAESMGKNDRAALAQAAQELDLQLVMTYVDESARPGPGVTVMAEGESVQ